MHLYFHKLLYIKFPNLVNLKLDYLQYYKRHDPQTAEEQEMMENLFNVLCSSLMAIVNRDRFLRGEGLQLMNLMLREKKMSRNGSLKVNLSTAG